MKRFTLAAVAAVVFSGAATAAPVGWIHPEMGRFTIGGEVHKVTDRDMEQNAAGGRNTGEVESLMWLGRGSYGLTDQFEIYGRLGGADADLSGTGSTTGFTLNTGSEFAWGIGIQGIIYDAGTWNLAGDAQYFAHNDHTNTSSGGAGFIPNNTRGEFDWKEWQLALQVQGQFDQFYPYLGVKFSDVTLDFSQPGGTPDVEADDNVGVYVGAGFNISPQWSGYVEGRFVDETAFGGGISYRF